MTPTKFESNPCPFRKAAILISALDTRSADALLERMGPERAARVRSAIMDLETISDEEQQRVIAEFMHRDAPGNPAEGIELDDSLAQKLASPAVYAEEHAAPSREVEPPPFRFLHEATTDALAKHLQREHPQIVAVVVAHLPPKRAADVLRLFDEPLQVDVLRRVAELDGADPDILRDVERELEMLLSDEIRAAKNRSAGLSAVRAILNAASSDRPELVQHVARHDAELMKQLIADGVSQTAGARRDFAGELRTAARPAKDRTLESAQAVSPTTAANPNSTTDDDTPPATTETTPQDTPHPLPSEDEQVRFEDLVGLDDRDLARLLQAAEAQWTLLALAGASEEMMARITQQLGGREARRLQQRLQNLGPLRLDDIQRAQERLAQLAARLADEGVIQLPGTRQFAAAA